MESHFHKKNLKGEDKPLIPDRDHAIAMLTFFMKLGLFYRGEREYAVRKQKKKIKDSDSDTESETEEQKRERKKKKYRLALSSVLHSRKAFWSKSRH